MVMQEAASGSATIVSLDKDYKPKRIPPAAISALRTGQPVKEMVLQA